MTHYDVLGLPASKDVTEAQIKAAFRRRALELHPDTLRGSSAATRDEHVEGGFDGGEDAPPISRGGDEADSFRRIQEAYAVLRDARSRRLYDKRIGLGGREEHEEEGPGMRARRAAAERIRQKQRSANSSSGGGGGGGVTASMSAKENARPLPREEADKILNMYRNTQRNQASHARVRAAAGRMLPAWPTTGLLVVAAATTAAVVGLWWSTRVPARQGDCRRTDCE